MSTRTPLLATACAVALTAGFALATPGRALANDECGAPSFGSNPQAVTCAAAGNPYGAGVTYDENTYAPANQGNLQVTLAGTAAVNTANVGVTANGAILLNSTVVVLNGAAITAGAAGVLDTATLGNATINNSGSIAAKVFGLDDASFGGGVGAVTNTANGAVTVTGAGAEVGIYASGSEAVISNAGTVTINGAGGGNVISGLATFTQLTPYTASITNTGSVSVTSGTDDAIGFGAEWTNSGSATFVNNGALSVAAGSGAAAYGFNVIGGANVSITDAQTVAGTTTTAITGSGDLTGVSVSGASGTVAVNLSGVGLGLSSSGATVTGVTVNGGVGDTVNVGAVTVGGAGYGADLSLSGAAATGVNVASAGGANSVTFTDARLVVIGGTGGATGVSVSGGDTGAVSFTPTTSATDVDVSAAGGSATGVSVNAGSASSAAFGNGVSVRNTDGDAMGVLVNSGSGGAAATFARTVTGHGTYLGDVYVTGSTGANGVEVNSGGPNSVTFTGANLTVDGGIGGANGVYVTGGSASAVTFALTTGPAALSVASSGSGATGVFVSGSGALSGAFGGGFNVSAVNGPAVGLALVGGTTQTATFADGLTVGATNGQAQGVYLNGASGLITAHLGGTISITSTGGAEAEGVISTGGQGGLTIDGAPTINVSGGGFTLGVLVENSAGPINATLGAMTIQSTATSLPTLGAFLYNAGPITLADAGVIDVAGAEIIYGADVLNHGTTGAISVTLGTVRVHGSTSNGGGDGVLVNNNATNGDPTSVVVQQISTTVPNTPGVNGGSNGGTTTVTVGSVAGGVHTGGVTTTGADSTGAFFTTYGGQLTITNNGLVSTTGFASYGLEGGDNGGAASVTVNNWQATTTGASSAGIVVLTGSGLGTVVNTSVTTAGAGSDAIDNFSTSGGVSVTSGLASTTGSASVAIDTSATTGPTTITSTTATTTGAASPAILANSTTGSITIASTTATTAGATSSAIQATSTSGAIAVTSTLASTTGSQSTAISTNATSGSTTIISGTATATGDHSNGILAESTTGAITITSGTASTTGARPNAAGINGVSDSGAVTINLTDGGSTTSAQGRGASAYTGGVATINVGSAAATATVSGGVYGVDMEGTTGNTLNIHGSVAGGTGAVGSGAIYLIGGAALVNNFGTINGSVTITSTGDTFNNAGTWNAFGADSTLDPPALNVLNNTGVITINPNATTAATYSVLAPGAPLTVNNSGAISLRQGAGGTPHTGDALNLGNAIYTGSGGATLLIDANLGVAAVGASGPQTADELLIQTGSVAGSTTIGVRDLGAALPGRFNFAGIPVVAAGSSSANAFTLAAGSINKGYVQYRLTQSAGNYFLVGLPSAGAFEVARTGFEAENYWRRSGDVWSGQMRESGFHSSEGITVWAQASAAGETGKSDPTYQVTAVNTFIFTPNLDIDNQWSGAQFGVDYGLGHWGYGFTAGFGQQLGRFKADGDHIDLNGANAGIYLRWAKDGLFFDALGKYDGYTVKQKNLAPNVEVDFNGSTLGAELQAGYRWTSGAAFVEPAVSLSWSDTSLTAFNSALAGAQVNFNHGESVYGDAGLRVGTVIPHGDWTLTPYAGAYLQGEMVGKNAATVATGGNALTFIDPRGGANGRFELGLSGRSKARLEFSAAVDGTAGGALSGVGGRIGLAYRW